VSRQSSARETVTASARETVTAQLRHVIETLLEQEEVSYTELTVTSICSAAGISRPTFYAYFDDKVELVRAIAAETIAELVDVSALWLAAPKATRDELNQAMTRLFEAYAPHRRIMATAAEVASYDAELQDAFTTAMEAAAARVAEHIAAGQSSGLVRLGLEPVATARWLGWMTELGLRRAYARRSIASRASIAAMTDIHWFTLYEAV
jgi:AcrR family transcriptional regulator